jgi:hypothetical protein
MFNHVGATTLKKKPAMDLRSSETMLMKQITIRIDFRAVYGKGCATLVLTVAS